MRRSLDRDGRFLSNDWTDGAGSAAAGFARLDVRPGATDLPRNAVARPPLAADLIIVTPDEAGDGIGLAPGNPSLVVDAPAATVGTLGTLGDQDFYQVTLEAGRVYEIGMFGHFGGPNLLPVLDSYLELYAADGSLVGSADGGASTIINSVNSGFDAVLTFTAATTGTYYVNARAFDNDPAVGSATGEGIGDYELYVHEIDPNDPGIYRPYYEASSPLHAIDWGTQVNRVNQTVRNPDGDEGTRATGNAQGTPVFDDPVSLAALAAAQGKDIDGKNVVTIYFAKAGDIFTSLQDPTSPGLPPVLVSLGTRDFEKATVWTALHQFEKVADIVYLEVPTRAEADFFFTTYAGTPGPGVSLLGSMSPPDYPDEGLAQFNSADYRWTEENLQQGGFSYVTLIHEFGHGHGLAHPHDNGGHSGVMNGVESEGVVADYTLGDYDLNQAVYTMMSYEDGWQTSPYGNAPTDVGYGYLGGLMAFDIAAIQDKYGVNEDWAAGNDVYLLRDVNAAGTFYSSIWDGGGTDAIVYAGARNTNIDLRAASLRYEHGGGGWISYADGIFGGFTIANGVTIENATGGSGDDIITGNDVANLLNGGAGRDRMAGGLGNDYYLVDRTTDVVVEGAGEGAQDRVFASADYTLHAGAYVEILSTDWHAGTAAIRLGGNAFANILYGNAGDNVLTGNGGADRTYGLGGDDQYFVDNAGDYVGEAAGGGTDRVFASTSYALAAGQSVETLSTDWHAGTGAIDLTGNALANALYGNAGANILNGGGGADLLVGFGGNDSYFVDHAGDRVVEAASGGADMVFAATSYSLASGQAVERLSTTAHNGTAAIDLSGNELANAVYGNAGANLLNGKGGSDTLAGFGGADLFLFDSALGAGNVDLLADFQGGVDRIMLDDAVFAGLGLGALGAGAFAIGAAAGDGNDRIVYDGTTGALLFDADGNGVGAAVQFAQLGAGVLLSAGDFLVV